MNKERDWMDYAQLGLTAAQTAQLGHLSGQMRAILEETEKLRIVAEAQANAAIAAHELEQANRQRLQQLRHAIWVAEQFLDKLEEGGAFEQNWLSRFVYVRQIEATLEALGVIPPTAVNAWEDIDRARKLASRITELRQNIHDRMTDEQRNQADTCWRFIQEQQPLNDLFRRRAELELRRELLEAGAASLKNTLKDCNL